MNKPALNYSKLRLYALEFIIAICVTGGLFLSTVYADASPSPTPCVNCGEIEITNNNNNTNNNTNNNNINITNPVNVSVVRDASVGGGEATSSATTKGGINETPQTGAGTVAIASLIGTGSLGVYLARYKKGQLVKEAVEENLAELGSIYVDLRSALKRNA